MPDKPTFVVNDRRKFTAEGEIRPGHVTETPAPKSAEPAQTPAEAPADRPFIAQPSIVTHNGAAELADLPEAGAISGIYPDQTSPVDEDADLDGADITQRDDFADDDSLPAGPTAEQAAEATRAYEATIDRLETAMRAANPGGERMPPMSFERLVQSLYTQALILLGGGAQPGETPRVDILGARETIDMLAVLADKARGNMTANEEKLLDSALFDLRMGFLEITQALARQAAQRQGAAPGLSGAGTPQMGAGPRIVR